MVYNTWIDWYLICFLRWHSTTMTCAVLWRLTLLTERLSRWRLNSKREQLTAKIRYWLILSMHDPKNTSGNRGGGIVCPHFLMYYNQANSKIVKFLLVWIFYLSQQRLWLDVAYVYLHVVDVGYPQQLSGKEEGCSQKDNHSNWDWPCSCRIPHFEVNTLLR